jgi:hypothetical protein
MDIYSKSEREESDLLVLRERLRALDAELRAAPSESKSEGTNDSP